MPFASTAIRNRARRRIAQQVRAGEPCYLCGRQIDLSIRFPDDWAFVVDHRIATSRLPAGTVDRFEAWAPAHNKCNRDKGALPASSLGRNSGVLG